MTEGPCIINANWSHLTVRSVKRAGDSNPGEKTVSFETVKLTVKKRAVVFYKYLGELKFKNKTDTSEWEVKLGTGADTVS